MGNQELQSADITPLEILDAEVEESGVTFEDLYAFLLEKEDIQITIDADKEEDVRRGITLVKHAHVKKLKAAGQKIDEKQIKFCVVRTIEGTEPKQIILQVWLVRRSSVHIHKMVVSDKDL